MCDFVSDNDDPSSSNVNKGSISVNDKDKEKESRKLRKLTFIKNSKISLIQYISVDGKDTSSGSYVDETYEKAKVRTLFPNLNKIESLRQMEMSCLYQHPRKWRFVPSELFYNKITKDLLRMYELTYMNTVESILNRFNTKVVEQEQESNIFDNINAIVFLDADNWQRIFIQSEFLPKNTLIYIFKSNKTNWKEPKSAEKGLYVFRDLQQNGMIKVKPTSLSRHDAADFTLVLEFGRLHASLKQKIAFIILSGDYGFCEVINQMMDSNRMCIFVNPHLKSNIKDKHYDEKMQDDEHLMDILKIVNYLSIVSSKQISTFDQ